MRGPRKQQDFQKFYFDYVAKGEGCGCAERIIDVAEFERRASMQPQETRAKGPGLLARLRRRFSRA